ncbi:carbon-nitrogen hydrolase [Gamsiella multidivaricata]|uniref:carbon-nitrogen hydrolase n=1 Tax=Gamsiella multidivaricata TaxID=101098 RepID=UPI00221FC9DD|nr:carbon-nitrogen hydrolase [Gamsiella multidivaricata]KAI7831286.1 carbon-nitrogen hydrolase [Gamsiella multidivaricata]
MKPCRLALVQLAVTADKDANLANARTHVLEAASNGANLIVLPECFNSPYGTKFFPEYAESAKDGPSVKALSAMAKEAKAYLIGGSIPEHDPTDDNIYNTCTVYNPEGEKIATHRKVHLFDIDVPGKIRFQESETLTAGNHLTHVDTDFGKIGVGICYDIRFPEPAMIAARQGCFAMIYPGAFNMTTGPLHWELLQRARAVDNQIFVAACSPARDLDASYHAWGHSTIVGPAGDVLQTMEEKQGIIYADLDQTMMTEFRQSIPLTTQRRFDLYADVSKVKP